MGGLSREELNAKILLLRHFGRFPELASFIEGSWGRLSEIFPHAGWILGGSIRYVWACGQAEKIVETRLAELDPENIPQFKLMIMHCRGEDPTSQARENYEASHAIVDLENLIRSLEGVKRWGRNFPLML